MSVSDLIFSTMAARGGNPIDVPVIIDAAVPLELSGEVVRSRICTFADADGHEWALRPDLTLPVAQAEIAARGETSGGETIRRYRGPVFRLPALAGEPVEYEQIGVERFGAPRGVDEDIWLFETLAEACVAAGVEAGETAFGDLSVFPGFVDALGLPEDVSAGLKRAFRQEGGVRAFLSGHAKSQTGLSRRLQGMDRSDIASFVDDIYTMTGLQPVGERTSDEVVERLFQRAGAAADVSVSSEVDGFLFKLLSLDLPYQEAPAALAALASDAGLSDVDSVLDTFAARTERLAGSDYSNLFGTAKFATRFGRRFTYYDGFVFEIAQGATDADLQRPIAAGGRYDSLLANLSGGVVTATAIGGIVIPHRLEPAAGGRS